MTNSPWHTGIASIDLQIAIRRRMRLVRKYGGPVLALATTAFAITLIVRLHWSGDVGARSQHFRHK
jgi:hypothetical protein